MRISFLAICNCCLSLFFVHLWEEPHSHLLDDLSWVGGDRSHIFSLVFSRLKRCSGPIYSSQQPTPHPSTHGSISPLQPLQFLRVSTVTEGMPKQNRALHLGPHECWMEGKNHFPCSAGDLPVMLHPQPAPLYPQVLFWRPASLMVHPQSVLWQCDRRPVILKPLEVPPCCQGPIWDIFLFFSLLRKSLL